MPYRTSYVPYNNLIILKFSIMRKRLFFAAGAVIALSTGIVAAVHFSERNR